MLCRRYWLLPATFPGNTSGSPASPWTPGNHAGTFHGEIKAHTFFKAVLELLRENTIDDIRINLIGAGSAYTIPSEHMCILTGRTVHAEAVKYKMGPKEKAADIIQWVHAGLVAGVEDDEGIKEAILKACELWDSRSFLRWTRHTSVSFKGKTRWKYCRRI